MMKGVVICVIIFLCIFLLGNFAYTRNMELMEEVITKAEEPVPEPEIKQKINEIREIIIGNIKNRVNIDTGINIDEIKAIMGNYESQPNSCIVKVDGKPYDLLVIGDLLNSYEAIRINWENIRIENIQQMAAETVNAKNNGVKVDDYALIDEISYCCYQSELASSFLMLFLEQFQLANAQQYDLSRLPEVIIEVLPLSTTVIYIDGIPYDAIAVETLQSLMRLKSDELIPNIRNELTNDVYRQFDKCLSNVDSYLDWYYGFSTGYAKIGEMFKGAIDRNRTAAEAVQEFMIKNYIEKIGNGMSFQNFVTILQRYRDETLEQAFVFASVLEDCIIEYDDWTESAGDITGNDYMASFIVVSDYLNKVVLEGFPLMGMGNKLDTEGIFLLDLANLLINFAPGVGWIAGTILDFLTLKLTEHWKRPDFEYQIKASIREDQRKLLNVIQIANVGGF